MKKFTLLSIIISFAIVSSCQESSQKKLATSICEEHSEWKDNDGPDSCSVYSKEESCDKIIGKLSIISRMHKNMLSEGNFEGGISSRWLIIEKETIKYYKPSGELADEGQCSCADGKLKINWKIGENVPEECEIHFNSSNQVELRYYDYPFNFTKLQYDKTENPSNPTKIYGTLE